MTRCFVLAVFTILGCGASSSESISGQDAITVDTSTDEARAQYEVNAAFASKYEARCDPAGDRARPRVLLAGFGRVYGDPRNAAGLLVSTLVPKVMYPMSTQPARGVDPPEAQ